MDARPTILAAFDKQIGWCTSLDSPLTAQILTVLRDDIASGGMTCALVDGWPGDPLADALALRMAGALHALALSGASPDLQSAYAAPGSPEGLRQVIDQALHRNTEAIRGALASPPQTNESGRSAVLLGGFLVIAARTGLPLRLLEIGASAGLNTVWDRFHYRLGTAEWGNPGSPVRLAPEWTGPLPPLSAPLHVAGRHACDTAPVDLDDPAQRLRLMAYVWPDQHARLERLRGAIEIARAHGPAVERADAAPWVARQLAAPPNGSATVLYHSIMWQYMPAATQGAITAAMAVAGRHATPAAPLAWLRFEPTRPDTRPALCLTLWPGGQEEQLATAHPHGAAIAWSHPQAIPPT